MRDSQFLSFGRARERLDQRSPAVYFPIERGLYEVTPGLKSLATDFGNGSADQKRIQIDADFPRYRREKLATRGRDRLDKYVGFDRLAPQAQAAVCRFLVQAALEDQPEFFSLGSGAGNLMAEFSLHCHLTGEILHFDAEMVLCGVERAAQEQGEREIVRPEYRDAFDALMNQFQEDAAIVSLDDGGDWLSALHVMSPSHWSPLAKLGQSFLQVHAPVPGFERIARAHRAIVEAMIEKGPFVRFVWSFVTDRRLNRHPEPPPGEDPVLWRGRTFLESQPEPFYLRVERQLSWGFPHERVALFLIRLSFIDGTAIRAKREWREALLSALTSMAPESRVYKGIEPCFDSLKNWLKDT